MPTAPSQVANCAQLFSPGVVLGRHPKPGSRGHELLRLDPPAIFAGFQLTYQNQETPDASNAIHVTAHHPSQ